MNSPTFSVLRKAKPAIELVNYTKSFGSFTAVRNLSMKVSHGVIHGFIGPNGAGKTTVIKALIGAYIPTSGKLFINGSKAGSTRANRQIGYIPERAFFPSYLNATAYLSTMAQLSGIKPRIARQKARVILQDINLQNHARRKPITFSSGMQKKILMAQALITQPHILILDEPAANLDPTARNDLFQDLITLRNQGTTIFISSHILAELERFVDEVSFLYEGRVLYSGKVDEAIGGISDVFVNTSNNTAVKKVMQDKYHYKVAGDLKTELIIKDVSVHKVKNVVMNIVSLPDISIKTLRTHDLQSAYNQLILKGQSRTVQPIQTVKTKLFRKFSKYGGQQNFTKKGGN